ncbi:MAG: metallophosphoesterase family protein [Usitatibacter sp.]
MRVGLISDTHGLLRPEALRALEGSDHIIHAGDIGDPGILAALARIAPVTAVRGNNDNGSWAKALAATELVNLEGAWIYVIHDVAEFDIDPVAAGVHAVVAGHSHKPDSRLKDHVLFVNPGSAGPRRFALPVSLGHLVISGGRIEAHLSTLEVSK